jgi:hypothetical protein
MYESGDLPFAVRGDFPEPRVTGCTKRIGYFTRIFSCSFFADLYLTDRGFILYLGVKYIRTFGSKEAK